MCRTLKKKEAGKSPSHGIFFIRIIKALANYENSSRRAFSFLN